jgi:serine/threonine-protein kinase
VLGDSVKRRQPPSRRTAAKKKPQAAGPSPAGRRRFWIAAAIAVILPFVVGYFIAVRMLFPPPPVVAAGIPVPDLKGESLESARQTLVGAGLGNARPSELPSLTVPEGTVMAQSPLPGQQLRAGAPVRLAISSGPPRVFVPDVVGFPVERAASLLVRLGFQVLRTDTVSTADADRVLAVNPDPGTRLVLPARVGITVSLGPPPDTIAADTFDAAIDTLTIARRVGWPDRPGSRIFGNLQRLTPHDDTRADGRN